MTEPLDGILLVDKGEGETSFAVVQRVRRFLETKKAGHAGTLDPFATGLLIVLLGQGTKLSPYLMSVDKRYLATIRLGVETDTQDPTGKVVSERPVPALAPEFIEARARRFVGDIEQVPPSFSALKVNGKRAYALARKGVKVEMEKRLVRISSLEITSIELPHVTMEVVCSKGTYIRSLASDLGNQLGPGAHLKALRRLSCGPYAVRDALSLVEHAAGSPSARDLVNRMIPLGEALPHINEIQVTAEMAARIRNGHQPGWTELAPGFDLPESSEGHMKLAEGKTLIAIMKIPPCEGSEKGRAKIMRVFH